MCTYTILGCTDPTALNYSSYANLDDGSCQYYVAPIIYGCMDEAALNYVANATEDDGSCIYEEDTPGFGLLVALISIIGVAFRRRN